ncbi:hypothetical protein KM043_000951 [Ampulex compressa]|nr:hypothetical protein KM043_000951 [Ampulex compressa]
MSTIGRGLELALRFMGVWPELSHATLYKFYWLSTMAAFQLFQYRYVLTRFGSSDLSSLVDSLSTCLPYTLLCLKLTLLWTNEGLLHETLALMAKDWRDNRATDSNVRIMQSAACRCHRCSNVIMALYSLAVVLYAAGIILSNVSAGKNGEASPRELPLQLELPFDVGQSPVYEAVLLVELLHELGAATTFGMMGALLLTLILHLGGQIDIVRKDISRVSSAGRKEIGRLIDRHREIITFSRNIERLFTYIALMQFVSNTAVICCLGFLILISIGTADGTAMLLKAAVFYIAINADAFIFCFAGEYLSAKSRTIGDAAYASFWYDLTPGQTRMLMLLILRSQKALTISVGKFMDLSLERFTAGERFQVSPPFLQAPNHPLPATLFQRFTRPRENTQRAVFERGSAQSRASAEMMTAKGSRSSAVTGPTLSKVLAFLRSRRDRQTFISQSRKLEGVLVEARGEHRVFAVHPRTRQGARPPKSPMSAIGLGLEIGLRFVGVWPDAPCALFFKLYWISTMALFQLFQYRYVITHFGSTDLTRLMDSLSTSLPYTLLCLKLIMLWANESVLRDVLASMTKDWRDNGATDSNVRIMQNVVHRCHRCSNIIMGLYSLSVVLYAAGTVLPNLRGGGNARASSRELPLKIELPFGIGESPIYETILLLEFIHQMGAATIFGMMSALLLTLTLHLGGQIDIMCRDVVSASLKGGRDVGRLIDRHREIIAFSRSIERLFTYMALTQFVSNTVVICCLGFLILISIGTADGTAMLVKSTLFYLVITLEAFVFCFAGEYLSVKSKTIGDAAYASFWYDMAPGESRSLMLLILRSQKALTISIGKFMDLSLERFTGIIKASGSYMSVLLAMY